MDKQRALVVEDRPDWQGILGRTLETIGWEVDIASSYDEALERIEQARYILAVIDPVLDNANKYNRDGLRVVVELSQKSPDTHILIVSGSVTASTIKDFPDLPRNLPLIEKQKWDRETFISLAQLSKISKQAQIGKSTVFRMLRSSQGGISASSLKDMPTPPQEEDRRGSARFLIVEDRPDWQVILAQTLEDENWFWRYVPDAGMALQLLRDKNMIFHVVLLDLRLGDADKPVREGEGWQLLEYLAHNQQRTRVIIVSGEASRGDVAELFTHYPIEGFIDKDSFKKNELLELIYRITAKPQIRVQTLGAFQVWRDGKDIHDFGSHEAELLLKILISHRGEVVSSEKLIRWLFPFTHTAILNQPRPALKAIVNTLCHLLEPELAIPEDSAFIIEKDDGYFLDISQSITLDFEEIEALLQKGKTQGHDAVHLYESARQLHYGEYLPNDRKGQWSVQTRSHVEKLYAEVLNLLSDLYAQQGDLKKALETVQECLQVDSYNEPSHRRLMRYQYCSGNKQAALVVYSTLEKLKREFFQEEPNPATQKLRDAILNEQAVECIEPTE